MKPQVIRVGLWRRLLWLVFLVGGIVTVAANAQADRKWQTVLVAIVIAIVAANLGAFLERDAAIQRKKDRA